LSRAARVAVRRYLGERSAIWAANAQEGACIYARGDFDAGDWNWSEHGDFQCGPCGVAGAVSLSQSGAAGNRLVGERTGGAGAGSGPGAHAFAGAEPVVR